MIRGRFTRVATTAVFSVAVFGACGDDAQPSGATTETEIANPASVFCVEQGGTVDIVDEAGGQVGYCNLPDGTRVEEWEYYRSQSAGTTDSVAAQVPVTISIEGLQGAMGQYLAGVLYSGSEATFPDERVVGGVAAAVSADPFSADLELRVGYEAIPDPAADCGAGQTSVPSDCIVFPYLTDEPRLVEPGPHTLQLWLAPTTIGPYSRWVPGDGPGLVGCVTTFEVETTGGQVTVTGIPSGERPDQPCTVD